MTGRTPPPSTDPSAAPALPPRGFEWRPGRSIPWEELRFEQDAAGGPGGQHANKTASRATLVWHPASTTAFRGVEKDRVLTALAAQLTRAGLLRLRSRSERSVKSNKADCLEHLRQLLAAALKPRRPRVATRPTSGSKTRRHAEKKRHAQIKQNRRSASDLD
ncbi:MAG: peptide chain release factor-like protein [Planctomycetota bacterium]